MMAQTRGVGPLDTLPREGAWVAPRGCCDSPTWTASLASSWGWDPGSSLCSCVSVGTKQRLSELKFSSFPVPSPEEIPLLSCHGDKSPLEGLSGVWHIQTSPRTDPAQPQGPSNPPHCQAPGSQRSRDPSAAVPRGYSRWKCAPCTQPAPGARGSVGTGTQSGLGGCEQNGGCSGEGLQHRAQPPHDTSM